jgi:hypothetical protein
MVHEGLVKHRDQVYKKWLEWMRGSAQRVS